MKAEDGEDVVAGANFWRRDQISCPIPYCNDGSMHSNYYQFRIDFNGRADRTEGIVELRFL